MSNGTRITSLAQLAPKVDDYDITNPVTGEVLTIRLRDLLPSEIAELRARRKMPKPPIDKRNPFKSGGIPNYDDEDPEYIAALAKYNNEYVYEWLLLAWDVSYPDDADTPDKKLEVLKKSLPYWAFVELNRRLNEMSGLRLSEVALAKKNLTKTNSGSSNTAPLSSVA